MSSGSQTQGKDCAQAAKAESVVVMLLDAEKFLTSALLEAKGLTEKFTGPRDEKDTGPEVQPGGLVSLAKRIRVLALELGREITDHHTVLGG